MESVRQTGSHVAWPGTILGFFLVARKLFLQVFKLLLKFVLFIYLFSDIAFETVARDSLRGRSTRSGVSEQDNGDVVT